MRCCAQLRRGAFLLLALLLLLTPQSSCFLVSSMTRKVATSQHTNYLHTDTQMGMNRRDVQENSLSGPDINNGNSKMIESSILFNSFFLLSPSLASATSDTTALAAKLPLEIFINTLSVFMLARIVISWYPKTDLNAMPYAAAVWPTEPLLEPVRGLVPPAFGVDVSPIVWLALLSFIREILTGQQGILTLMEQSAL